MRASGEAVVRLSVVLYARSYPLVDKDIDQSHAPLPAPVHGARGEPFLQGTASHMNNSNDRLHPLPTSKSSL